MGYDGIRGCYAFTVEAMEFDTAFKSRPDKQFNVNTLIRGDGVVDSFDMCQMRRAAVEGDAERFEAADINADDVIDGEDLVLLKKFILGEIKSF